MYFTTLFSMATSVALATAGIIQNRDDSTVAVLRASTEPNNDQSCSLINTETIQISNPASRAIKCIPFDKGYTTVQLTDLEDGWGCKCNSVHPRVDEDSDIAKEELIVNPQWLCTRVKTALRMNSSRLKPESATFKVRTWRTRLVLQPPIEKQENARRVRSIATSIFAGDLLDRVGLMPFQALD